MANKETIKKLDHLVRELICLFSEYFIINNVYGDDQRLKRIEVKEVFESDEFVKYDYESIYKNIDDVVDKIKGIDSGSNSFILSDEETKRVIDNALMTMFGRD